MCQATAYLDDEIVMQDVIWIEPTEDGFYLRTFFGEPKTIKGKLKGIDLLKHRVLLVSEQALVSEKALVSEQALVSEGAEPEGEAL